MLWWCECVSRSTHAHAWAGWIDRLNFSDLAGRSILGFFRAGSRQQIVDQGSGISQPVAWAHRHRKKYSCTVYSNTRNSRTSTRTRTRTRTYMYNTLHSPLGRSIPDVNFESVIVFLWWILFTVSEISWPYWRNRMRTFLLYTQTLVFLFTAVDYTFYHNFFNCTLVFFICEPLRYPK